MAISPINNPDKQAGNITNAYYHKSHLVVIGISKYAEENQLPNAQNDANGVLNVLIEKYGFTVLRSLSMKMQHPIK